MTWGEEVAQRRIKRALERGSSSLYLRGLGLSEVPDEVRRLRGLKALHLGLNQLDALPDWLPELTGLVQLQVARNDLTVVPEWIGEFPELRYLQLSRNPILELPRAFLRLPGLTTLWFTGTHVDEPPDWLADMPGLRSLGLRARPFDEIPDWVESLTGLTELGFHNAGATTLPTWFAKFVRLEKLWLNSNSLPEVPGVIRQLGRLTDLDLEDNLIETVPDWLGELNNLRTLNLNDNHLSALPKEIGKMTGLRLLSIERNKLSEVPDTLAELGRLTSLSLNDNNLKSIPETLGRLRRLRKIELGGCSLTQVPDFVRSLKNLTHLWVHNNQITRLPDWIGELSRLRTLFVTGNQLSSLPDALGDLPQFEALYAGNNLFSEFPAVISTRSSLRHLILSQNELGALPARPAGLTRLRSLYLSQNRLEHIPEWVGSLTRLEQLSFSDNSVVALPASLRDHPRLDTLVMSAVPAAALPEWLGDLPSLTELGLEAADSTAMPDWVRRLGRLQRLFVMEFRITELPDWLGELRQLEFLSLYNTKIDRLPDSIRHLHKLRHLNLNGSNIRELPEWIGELTRLTTLAAGEGRLAHVPDSIGSLTQLDTLYLSQSDIEHLPDSIGGLHALKFLRVADGGLRAVPASIGKLTKLRWLEVSGNRITSIPDCLVDLPALRDLLIHGNPLLSPPPEIAAAGTSAILAFLANRKKGSARQWTSKLLVVGEGGVGKTSLIKQLTGEVFDPDEDTTHGLRTYDYAIDHPELADVRMRLRVWDFGGQEIYHATHQFFLTDRSLFVLLWNGRLGWKAGKLRYWLDIIKARAPFSPILLVATHSPAGGRPADLPLADLRIEYPQLVDNFSVDNETGDGLCALAEAIRTQSAGLPLMGAEWPQSWLDASESVRQIPEDHIPPARLWRTMAEAGLVDQRHQTYVAGADHALGNILYYSADPELRETVILRPEWVNAYISRVLDDPEVERCHGLLRRSRLDELWGELDRGMRDHFLAMMDKYDLSYKTGTEAGDDVSLVVERLSWQAPEYQATWDAPASPDLPEHEIRVTYELSTMPPGIPTWFIARSHRFSTGTHWRTGALLAHPDGRHRALIRADRERKYVELAVRGPAPAAFFALLDDGLNLTLERYPGLSITRKVPCSCSPGCVEFYDYDDLQRRVTREQPLLEIECRKSYSMVHVPLLLLGLPPSERDEMRAALKKLEQQNVAIGGRLCELASDQQRMFLKLQQQIQTGLETKCPSVFTVTAVKQSRITGSAYALHLYCEEPGSWHPLQPDGTGVYELARSPAWLIRMAPHLRTLVSLLKHAAPLVGPVLGTVYDHVSERLSAEVEGMAELVDQLPEFDGLPDMPLEPNRETGAHSASTTPGRPPSEADYRALEGLLLEVDPQRIWGGLSRITTPEGLTLYLCPAHAAPYHQRP